MVVSTLPGVCLAEGQNFGLVVHRLLRATHHDPEEFAVPVRLHRLRAASQNPARFPGPYELVLIRVCVYRGMTHFRHQLGGNKIGENIHVPGFKLVYYSFFHTEGNFDMQR